MPQDGLLKMPPRRKNKKRSRRRFTGINVLDAAQAYAQLSIWSQALTNLNPVEFVLSPSGGGSTAITLTEVFGMGSQGGGGISEAWGSRYGGRSAMDAIAYNFKENWLQAAISSTLTGIGFTAAKKLTKSPRRMANKAIKQLGLGSMVRV